MARLAALREEQGCRGFSSGVDEDLSFGGSGLEALRDDNLNAAAAKSAEALQREKKPKGRQSWAASPDKRREFMEKVANEHGIKCASDWKAVTYGDIKAMGGSALLKQYPSVYDLLAGVFPEQNLSVFECRSQVPRNYWESSENRLKFIEYAKQKLGIVKPADWAPVTKKQLADIGGRSLTKKYGSVNELLEDSVEEGGLGPLTAAMFVRKPREYWSSKDNQREFLRYLERELEVVTVEEWADVKSSQVLDLGGRPLLSLYNNSLVNAVRELLKDEVDVSVLADTRARMPNGHFERMENRRAFMEGLREKFQVTEPSQWKKVSYADIEKEGGATLLQKYPSVLSLLKDVFPEEEIDERARKVRSKSYWENPVTRKAFLDGLAKKFKVKTAADWKSVREQDVKDQGGTGLFSVYPNLLTALQETYPEQEITTFNARPKVEKGHWKEADNRREFLDSIARTLQIEEPKDWKNVKEETVRSLGGSRFLSRYKNLFEALQDVYPEHDWDVFKCRRKLPAGYWKSKANILSFMEKVKRTYRIKKKEDWYRISVKQILDLRGGHLMAQMKLVDALRTSYPDEEWDAEECAKRVKKSSQMMLANSASALLPGYHYLEEAKLPHMRSSRVTSGRGGHLELDLYFPDLNLAFGMPLSLSLPLASSLPLSASLSPPPSRFLLHLPSLLCCAQSLHTLRLTEAEYNGEHHYNELGFFGPVEMYQLRDREKRALAKENGIALVTVPYWWDKRLESLAASIHQVTPGLFGDDCPEPRDTSAQKVVEQVLKGKHDPISPFLDTWKPLLSKLPKLPQALNDSIDPAGYLMSESYNGTRVRWSDGCVATVELGRILEVPAWWTAQLPRRTELEGYLSMGPGKNVGRLSRFLAFSTGGRVRGTAVPTSEEGEREEAWKEIRFVGFDIPTNDDFGTRAEMLAELPGNEVFKPVHYVPCRGREHMNSFLEEVTAQGGEGVLLRYPRDKYDGTRTQDSFFRVKSVQKATVTMKEASSAMNALIVEGPTGKAQSVRCSSQVYGQPPAPGTPLVVGHVGQWDSGRLKYPFLLGLEEDQ